MLSEHLFCSSYTTMQQRFIKISPRKSTMNTSPSDHTVTAFFRRCRHEFLGPSILYHSYQPAVTKCPGTHRQCTGTFYPSKKMTSVN